MRDRVFFDANVLIDHLLARKPFAAAATSVWSRAERGEVDGCMAAISFNFVYYIIRGASGEAAARRGIGFLRTVFEIIPVDARVIHQAMESGFADFKDAIQHTCALHARATHILTRDPQGFAEASMPALSPAAYLRSTASSD